MPAYHVARSKVIVAPTEKVHAALADYREWPGWSPWLIMEPETRLVYSDRQGEPGASYDRDMATLSAPAA
ncbi:MAG: hypothetical protein LJE91_11180 [Gammaproteobacteria bacterium]|jgi:hypothetical protein|nr:hypothetical protein [Gammaproteobacteria bacterium]